MNTLSIVPISIIVFVRHSPYGIKPKKTWESLLSLIPHTGSRIALSEDKQLESAHVGGYYTALFHTTHFQIT